MAALAGLVLAAGGGSRYGMPKALARTAEGRAWLVHAVAVLQDAGCAEVVVVLGAAADEARPLVPSGARVVVARRWAAGMGTSLATGLGALPAATAALVTLVDLQGLPVAVCERVLADPVDERSLRRATYSGRPGHPVLLGSRHWAPLAESLSGDRGGRDYLAAHGVQAVECGELFDGADVDR